MATSLIQTNLSNSHYAAFHQNTIASTLAGETRVWKNWKYFI